MSEGRSRHDELRALAEAATPGPWHPTDCRHQRGGQIRMFSERSQIANVLTSGGRAAQDAAYIAAMAPDALLALLDELAAAEARAEKLEQALQEIKTLARQGGHDGYVTLNNLLRQIAALAAAAGDSGETP